MYEPFWLQFAYLLDPYVFCGTTGLGVVLLYEFLGQKIEITPNPFFSVLIFVATLALMYWGKFLILINADIYYLVPLFGLSALLAVTAAMLFRKQS